MWKAAFKKFEGIWSAWNFLKAVFHKFYLVHSWIVGLNHISIVLQGYSSLQLKNICLRIQLFINNKKLRYSKTCMFCTCCNNCDTLHKIWYHLYNLKTLKRSMEECFHVFKLYKWYQITQRIFFWTQDATVLWNNLCPLTLFSVCPFCLSICTKKFSGAFCRNL